MKAKRRRFDPALKAKIGREALKGIKTVVEIARVGLLQNAVLLEKSARAMMDARARHCLTGAVRTRVFTEFAYETKSQTWRWSRRIVAKAEVTAQGDTPRLYEELYCARGEMENVLKPHMLETAKTP